MIRIPLIVVFIAYIIVASVLAVRGTYYRKQHKEAERRIRMLEDTILELQNALLR